MISGHYAKNAARKDDSRTGSPRFVGDNLDRNLALVEELRAVADDLGLTVAQAATAWVAARGTDVVPLVGARTRQRLAESLGAADAELTEGQVARIEAAMPASGILGDRYPATHMAALDSEG
ncbi:aldo/keto reductase [Mycolicibacterium sp. jd]|uniref:aldo/keto reductase n=1 Tax=unclassified Mycolicibacterium TaxID=2636767 RepID=UPI000CF9AD0E|nr:aldo/keto reductase [Mycolicibacterium sp. D5.8-2]MDW5614828.1 aldo/keto reductase [Mycolicibacterium sp. D5.8-2]PQP43846.1 hypothetical protein C6A88_23290 [Mycolicibacterium austroafricanum]